MTHRDSEKGFTIIELLLATTFFSFILIFVVAGFVQINRSYTKGLTVKNVQNSARILLDDITKEIRSSQAGDITYFVDQPSSRFRLCIAGRARYAWNQWRTTSSDFSSATFQATTTQYSLVKTTDASGICGGPIINDDRVTSPLDETLMIQHLSVEPVAGTTSVYRVTLVVSSARSAGNNDFATNGANAACRVQVGDQFCDIARLETIVSTRN